MMRTAISPRLATKSFCMRPGPSLCNKTLSQREGGTLNCAPSAVADAGRGRKISHAENAVVWRCQRLLHSHGDGQAQDTPGLQGVENTVVPEPRRGVIGRALMLIQVESRLLESPLCVLGHECLTRFAELLLLYRKEHASSLLATHHRDAGTGPHEEQTWRVRPSAHAIVASSKGASHDQGKTRYLRIGHGHDHFRAIFGDAATFSLHADHEAGAVLQKQNGHLALVT